MIFDSFFRWVHVVFLAYVFGMIETRHAIAFQLDPLSVTDDESQQMQAAERFTSLLEKKPQFGTAFDKVYSHQVEFGTLADFLQRFRDRIEANAKDDTAWLLLGMFEYQRGSDSNAVDALRQAILLRPKEVLPHYYLGLTLLRMGETAKAVEAFEQAIEKEPGRVELLEISLQLGRVHQRAQRPDEALKVWARLESKMPDDPRVLEQIVATLVEGESYSQALPRLEYLAEIVKDDFQRVQFRVQAADLKIKTNRRNEAIADFEAILGSLSPSSWLARDVRRRIEEVFVKSADQDSLVKYYEDWIAHHPEDIEAISRLANVLASTARMPEAMQWMEKAVRRAPSRADLRRAYIVHLVDDKRIHDALKQYEYLVEAEPGNPDFLRDWGKLVLKDPSREMADRREDATRIWNGIVALRPNDASNLSQVADYFRQNQFSDEAIALYQKAIELAPGEPQYREYLGEYYFLQKRPEEAIKTWKSMADGARRSAGNVLRLAEVYRRFGFLDEAIIEIAEACRLDSKDFGLQLRGAEFYHQADRYAEALELLKASDKLATNDDERESVLRLQIDVLHSSEQLDAWIEKLSASLLSGRDTAAAEWYRLARYNEANRDWNAAMIAIEEALKDDPRSIRILETSARISEAAGEYEKAIASYRELATIDRRSLGNHLMSIAKLESQLGRFDEAIRVAQELIVSAPGNTDHYQLYAQMCFLVDRQADGLAALRKALRITPNEPHLILALGAALSDQMKIDEAIELYWQAFDRSDEIDDITSLIGKLVPLYQQIDQVEKLLERLQNVQRNDEAHREATICLAQVNFATGDFHSARVELESLLNDHTRDSILLRQLAKLCEASGDSEGAVQYQRRLVAIAPGTETEFPLANMLYSRGEIDEANEIIIRLTRLEVDVDRVLKTLDSLMTQSNFESAIAILEPLLVQRRDDWELAYRAGVAYAFSNNKEQARAFFQQLLSMNIPHDSLSITVSSKQTPLNSKAESKTSQSTASMSATRRSPYDMLDMAPLIHQAVELTSSAITPSTRPSTSLWMPEAFGLARMASFAWLMKLGDEDVANNDEMDPDDAKSVSRRDAIYDWLYIKALQFKSREILEMASRLVKNGGLEERRFFLKAIMLRQVASERSSSGQSRRHALDIAPLDVDDIETMMKCFEEVAQNKKLSEFNSASTSGQIISTSSGTPYTIVGGRPVSVTGASASVVTLVHAVVRELELAGQSQRSDEMLTKFLEQASTSKEVATAMRVYFDFKRPDKLLVAFHRWVTMTKKEMLSNTSASGVKSSSSSASAGSRIWGSTATLMCQWIGELGAEREHRTVLDVLDSVLNIATLEANLHRRSRMSRSPASSKAPTSAGPSKISYLLYYGRTTMVAEVSFPRPNEYMNTHVLQVLRQANEIFSRHGQLAEFSEHLQSRQEKASNEDKWIEQLFLATALWWANERQEALALMTQAAEKLADDIPLRLSIAAMRQSRGELDEAMSIVDSIEVRDPTLSKQRELLALSVAEKLGERERAIEAATRLFGMRLDTKTQIELSQSMRRLGMDDLANTVRSRIERRSSADPLTLASLLASYQEQGKREEAKKVAIALLQRTPRTLSSSSINLISVANASSIPPNGRTQALKLLEQIGELDRMIQQTEARLSASPGSIRLCEELVEYYTFAGQRNKISGMLEKVVEANPDSVTLRLLAANYYSSPGGTFTSSSRTACRHYLVVLKRQPSAIGPHFARVVQSFKSAGQTSELIHALKDVNVHNFQSPYAVADLLTDSNRDKNQMDEAIQLFEKVYNTSPNYRSIMLSKISGYDLWQNDRMFALCKRSFIPTPDQVRSQPWYGLTESIQGAEKVTSYFESILQSLRSTSHLSAFQNSIEKASTEMPDWLAGKAMLAMLDFKKSEDREATDKLLALFADENLIESMPPITCWIIGQEARKFKDIQPIAFKLLQRAMALRSPRYQYSPITQLVELGKSLGREEEIRGLLMELVHGDTVNPVMSASSTFYAIENKLWIAQKLGDYGMPIESVQIYRELLSDPKELETAGTIGRRDEKFYISQANREIKEAMRKIGMLLPSIAFDQLLKPPELSESRKAVLDLNIARPPFELDAIKPLESELLGMLDRFIKFEFVESRAIADSSAKLLDDRLVALQSKYPNDLSIGITIAVTRLRNKSDQALLAVRQLVGVAERQGLPFISEKRRPKASQLEIAAHSIPLWIVARECLQHEDLLEEGHNWPIVPLRQLDYSTNPIMRLLSYGNGFNCHPPGQIEPTKIDCSNCWKSPANDRAVICLQCCTQKRASRYHR